MIVEIEVDGKPKHITVDNVRDVREALERTGAQLDGATEVHAFQVKEASQR